MTGAEALDLSLFPFAWVGYGVLAVFALMYVLISFTFHYHWRNYGIDARVIRLTLISYYALSAPLFLIALGIGLSFL